MGQEKYKAKCSELSYLPACLPLVAMSGKNRKTFIYKLGNKCKYNRNNINVTDTNKRRIIAGLDKLRNTIIEQQTFGNKMQFTRILEENERF